MDKKIEIEITEKEAIVLFDIIAKFTESSKIKPFDIAEQRVLYNLESILESKLDFVVDEKYNEILEEAKEDIKKSHQSF